MARALHRPSPDLTRGAVRKIPTWQLRVAQSGERRAGQEDDGKERRCALHLHGDGQIHDGAPTRAAGPIQLWHLALWLSSRRLSRCRCNARVRQNCLRHATRWKETTRRFPCREEARRNLPCPHNAIGRRHMPNSGANIRNTQVLGSWGGYLAGLQLWRRRPMVAGAGHRRLNGI